MVLTKKELTEGTHVQLETTIKSSVKETEMVINQSVQNQFLLKTDVAFLSTGSVQKKMRQLVDKKELGNIIGVTHKSFGS